MMRRARPLPVICLAGPTGAGKTALALEMAGLLDGEIINADSRQVYAAFPLICAQPSPAEQSLRPHHLYGFLPTDRKISAGRWTELAERTVESVLERGRTPILTGGTGMYFHALLHGIAAIPRIDPAITARLAARLADAGAPVLHGELARIDPAYAGRIHPNDSQRIVRALEVWEGTGRPFSWWHEHAAAPPLCRGPLLVLKTDMAWLAPRLARRIDAMLAAGALEEARAALAHCDDAAAPGWSGIGCAELLAHLKGRLTLEECRKLWLRNTRAYAKRQNTWFRGRQSAVFLPPDDGKAALATAKRLWKDTLREISGLPPRVSLLDVTPAVG